MLDYEKRRWKGVHHTPIALVVFMILVALSPTWSVHAVYFAEMVHNGREPIPPDHGSQGNTALAVLYNISVMSFVIWGVMLVIGLAYLFATCANRRSTGRDYAVSTYLLVAWVVPIVGWWLDPVGAMNFFLD